MQKPEMKNDLMRVSNIVLVAALVAGSASAAVQGQTVQGTRADEQAIRDLVALHASASQQDDLEGLVAGLHDDADSRRADGRILSGRAEIEKRYRDVMSGGPTRMAHTHPPGTLRIRFLQSDVAFVDVDSASVAGQGPRTPFFLVFTKVQGKWGVAVERSGVPLK
jgi:ketosteroid isomerase-like protein